MAASDGAAGQTAKRRHEVDEWDANTANAASKRARHAQAGSELAQPPVHAAHASQLPAEAIPTSIPTIPHDELLAELQGKYEVRLFSVLSSTSMQKRVDAILKHLGRFHPWDLSVLPGVVLLCSKSAVANKLISVVETVRRRVHEADQKWYQYNRLFEQRVEVPFNNSTEGGSGAPDASVIEDTVLAAEGGGPKEEDDGDDDFETMPALFERATQPVRVKTVVYMSVFLSRVPVPELAAKEYITGQSNEELINHERRTRNGGA